MMYPAGALDRAVPIAERPSLNPGPVGFAVAGLVLGALYLNAVFTWRQAALFLVGGAAGVVLYHAAFGFTSAWRQFIAEGRGAGLRANASAPRPTASSHGTTTSARSETSSPR